MPPAPTIPLRNGAAMPRIGLGTWPMTDAAAETLVPLAIQAGYRLIDTAENYGNEAGIGQGIRACGVPREELFITTKFNKEWHGVDLVRRAFDGSAQRLGLDYIDLLLIHWPNPAQDRYVDAWRGLNKLLEEGRLKAIGTSNFKPSHLQRLMDETGTAPEVNQIELSPALPRDQERAFHAQHGILTESWSPLGGGRTSLLSGPTVARLASHYGKNPAQIVLRWHIQQELIAIPRSTNPERARQNLEVFDFALDAKDMAALATLNRGGAAATDSDRFGH